MLNGLQLGIRALGVVPLVAAACICVTVGVMLVKRYPLSGSAASASLTLLCVGATGLAVAALATVMLLIAGS